MPGLNSFQLLVLSLAVGAFCIGRLRQVWTLMRRARWLLFLMLVTYGYSLPGDALFPDLLPYTPTREGLWQGLGQAWRLALLLLLLDVLLLRLPVCDLLTGIHSIMRPFTVLGLDRERVAVRLALTMEAMAQPRGWAGMRELLAGQAPLQSGPGAYVLVVRPYHMADWAVLAMLSLGVAWLHV